MKFSGGEATHPRFQQTPVIIHQRNRLFRILLTLFDGHPVPAVVSK